MQNAHGAIEACMQGAESALVLDAPQGAAHDAIKRVDDADKVQERGFMWVACESEPAASAALGADESRSPELLEDFDGVIG